MQKLVRLIYSTISAALLREAGLPIRQLLNFVSCGQARRLHAHFEAARGLYNALLGEPGEGD